MIQSATNKAYNNTMILSRRLINRASMIGGTKRLSSLRKITFKSSRAIQAEDVDKRRIHFSRKLLKSDQNNGREDSPVVNGLAASSTWRRGELSKLSDKFDKDEIDESQPLKIDNDDDVQQMWKDMENRVTRRRTMTISEAKMIGKGVGRKNLRKTDEEAWLEAGLYEQSEDGKK